MSTFHSHHHETQTSHNEESVLILEEQIGLEKLCISNLGLFKLNQSPNLKILDYIILPLFENSHTDKTLKLTPEAFNSLLILTSTDWFMR